MQRYDRLFSAGLPQFAVTVAATAIIFASLSHAETITFNCRDDYLQRPPDCSYCRRYQLRSDPGRLPGFELEPGLCGKTPSHLELPPAANPNNTVSQPNIAFGDPAASINAPNGGSFTLNSFYLGAAWNDGLQVTVLDKNNGTSVDSATFTVNTNGSAILETLNWSGINEADFSGVRGVPHGYTNGAGMNFVLDNLTVNGSAPTPTPTPTPSPTPTPPTPFTPPSPTFSQQAKQIFGTISSVSEILGSQLH